LVASGQEVIAELTDLYMSSILESLLGEAVPETGHVPTEYRKADPQEVYARMFKTVYYELSQGKDIQEAATTGQRRAVTTGGTDLWLAHTITARDTLNIHSSREGQHVVGYRRVPSGVHTCALCEIASTQRYHKADLMPIHNRCSCGVLPIVDSRDPGQVIKREYMQKAQQEHLSNDEVQVEQHSEIGPMLTFAEYSYRTAAEAQSPR
jgi:hypothetical protein